ncbi:cupin domain-containing protein [Bacillus sp. B1-b2]|uniref:cupin domain-containing protein n=1 Tax=Bacillus sp. B1-b2 TaxID=2653201 RepID=UPI001D00C397|nr:cupin domain-containing protein [Bacillus sp. B1-b2]
MTIPFEEVFSLRESITFRKNQITSRIVISDKNTHIVLYAMDAEESISSESSPHSKMLIVIEGNVKIVMDDSCHTLRLGEALLIESNKKHSIEAEDTCKFIQINFNKK